MAGRGHRVLMVDKGRFPSDTMSTHYIQFAGVSLLRRWGLENRVAETNCPPITQMTVDFGPFALSGRPRAADGTDVGYAPRRRVLDQLLIEAAIEAGVELREAFAVEDLVWDDDRAAGVGGRTPRGTRATERATVVVGADGLGSMVARLVGAPLTVDRGTLACCYYTYWSDVPATDSRPTSATDAPSGCSRPTTASPASRWAGSAPCSTRCAPTTRPPTSPPSPKPRRSLICCEATGRREERFCGTGRLPIKDPGTARGITDALAHVQLLAGALDDGLTGARPLDEALADYEHRRDEEAMPFFEFNCGLAALEPPPPETRQLLAAVHGNQNASDQFLGMIAGTTRVEAFFAPINVERVLAGAAA